MKLGGFPLMDRLPRSQWMILLVVGVVCVTAVVGFVVIYQPWEQKRAGLHNKQREEQQRSELLATLRVQAEQLKKQETITLLEGGTATLMNEIGQLSSRSGLPIESVLPQPEVSMGPYFKCQIRVEALARFTDLFRFIVALEQHQPFLKLEQIEVGNSLQNRTGGFVRVPERQSSSAEVTNQRAILLISALSRLGEGS